MGLIQGSTNKEVDYFKEVNGPFSVLRKGCVIQGQEVISTFDVYLGSSLSKIPKWKPVSPVPPLPQGGTYVLFMVFSILALGA